jgi:hypothetical protein
MGGEGVWTLEGGQSGSWRDEKGKEAVAFWAGMGPFVLMEDLNTYKSRSAKV